jgi:uncharacterized protein (DUF924 family)
MGNGTSPEIVSFWRQAGPDRWFEVDEDFDQTIRSKFLTIHEAAARGDLTAFEETAEGALALLILLDQFPRNMFRNSARAFATDPLAHAVANRALARGFDQETDKTMRPFFICLSCILSCSPIRIAPCDCTRRSVIRKDRDMRQSIATSS